MGFVVAVPREIEFTISTLIHYTSVSVLTCWSHECVGQ